MAIEWNWKTRAVAVAAVVVVAGVGIAVTRGKQAKAVVVAAPDSQRIAKTVVAGPGMVEPDSEDVKVGSELSGKLKAVLVEEGDRVKKGQVLAELVNDDYRAQADQQRAKLHEAEAALEKVMNGSRPQERGESQAAMRQAEATEATARNEWDRRQKLFDAGVISKDELERYERDFRVAEEQYEAAKQHFHLVDDRQRKEDIDAAKAAVEGARAQLAEAEAEYAKTFVHAPFDGTILRKHHRTGESITNSSVTPDPVFTMGDLSGLRVRVDVDESDVSRVANGQRVYCMAKAYGEQKYWGRVIRVAGQLGHKNVQTDEPKEKVDTKILETLVQLDPGVKLQVGLRVDAYIEVE